MTNTTGRTLDDLAREAVAHPLCPAVVREFINGAVRAVNLARTERDAIMRQAVALERRVAALERGEHG